MRAINVLASAVHLITILLIFALGFFLIFIYLDSRCLNFFLDLVINKPYVFFKMGYLTLSLGFGLFLSFFAIYKAQYIKFSLNGNNNKCFVNTNLVQKNLIKYFENIYPDFKKNLKVCLTSNNKLEIIATVKSLENQEEFVLDMEDKIKKLLADQLNYQEEFIFTLRTN